jgi:ribosomal RNA-processing protein 1
MGLPNHLSDIYIEELDKALTATSEQKPRPAPLGTLLNPFFHLMARTQTTNVYKRIQSSLLEPLLETLATPSRSDDEPSSKRARRDVEAYSELVANACFDAPESGRIERAELKNKLVKRIFEIASRTETKDASRRKMYALWKERAEAE